VLIKYQYVTGHVEKQNTKWKKHAGIFAVVYLMHRKTHPYKAEERKIRFLLVMWNMKLKKYDIPYENTDFATSEFLSTCRSYKLTSIDMLTEFSREG